MESKIFYHYLRRLPLYFKIMRMSPRYKRRPYRKSYYKRQLAFLECLVHLSPKQFKTVISHLDQTSVNYICDFIFAIINDTDIDLKLDEEKIEQVKQCLKGNRKLVEYLTNGKKHYLLRQKRLEQSGGFLGTLLAVGLPVLAEIIISQVT